MNNTMTSKRSAFFMWCVVSVCLLSCGVVISRAFAQASDFRRLLNSALRENRLLLMNVTIADEQTETFYALPVSYVAGTFRCLAVAQSAYQSDARVYDMHIMDKTFFTKHGQMNILRHNYFMLCNYNAINTIDYKIHEPELSDKFDMIRTHIDTIKELILSNREPGLPVKIVFKDRRALECMIDIGHRQYLDTFLALNPKITNRFSEYVEFRAAQLDAAPRIRNTDEPGIDEQSITRRGLRAISARPGFITNMYSWLGRSDLGLSGAFASMVTQLDAAQYASLYSLRVIDLKGRPVDLQIQDIAQIETIDHFDDSVLLANAHNYFAHIEAISSRLRMIWDDMPDDTVYASFYDRPFFWGKLVEFVPSYHDSKIMHAVIARENGDFIIIRSPLYVERIQIDSLMVGIDRSNRDALLNAATEAMFPDNISVAGAESALPLTVPPGPEYSANTILQINALTTIDYSETDTKKLPVVLPAGEQTLLALDITVHNQELEDGASVPLYFDEFSLYDADGRYYPLHWFVTGQDTVSDVISVEHRENAYTLMFVINPDIHEYYLKCSDMVPVKLIAPEKKKAPTPAEPDNESLYKEPQSEQPDERYEQLENESLHKEEEQD